MSRGNAYILLSNRKRRRNEEGADKNGEEDVKRGEGVQSSEMTRGKRKERGTEEIRKTKTGKGPKHKKKDEDGKDKGKKEKRHG